MILQKVLYRSDKNRNLFPIDSYKKNLTIIKESFNTISKLFQNISVSNNSDLNQIDQLSIVYDSININDIIKKTYNSVTSNLNIVRIFNYDEIRKENCMFENLEKSIINLNIPQTLTENLIIKEKEVKNIKKLNIIDEICMKTSSLMKILINIVNQNKDILRKIDDNLENKLKNVLIINVSVLNSFKNRINDIKENKKSLQEIKADIIEKTNSNISKISKLQESFNDKKLDLIDYLCQLSELIKFSIATFNSMIFKMRIENSNINLIKNDINNTFFKLILDIIFEEELLKQVISVYTSGDINNMIVINNLINIYKILGELFIDSIYKNSKELELYFKEVFIKLMKISEEIILDKKKLNSNVDEVESLNKHTTIDFDKVSNKEISLNMLYSYNLNLTLSSFALKSESYFFQKLFNKMLVILEFSNLVYEIIFKNDKRVKFIYKEEIVKLGNKIKFGGKRVIYNYLDDLIISATKYSNIQISNQNLFHFNISNAMNESIRIQLSEKNEIFLKLLQNININIYNIIKNSFLFIFTFLSLNGEFCANTYCKALLRRKSMELNLKIKNQTINIENIILESIGIIFDNINFHYIRKLILENEKTLLSDYIKNQNLTDTKNKQITLLFRNTNYFNNEDIMNYFTNTGILELEKFTNDFCNYYLSIYSKRSINIIHRYSSIDFNVNYRWKNMFNPFKISIKIGLVYAPILILLNKYKKINSEIIKKELGIDDNMFSFFKVRLLYLSYIELISINTNSSNFEIEINQKFNQTLNSFLNIKKDGENVIEIDYFSSEKHFKEKEYVAKSQSNKLSLEKTESLNNENEDQSNSSFIQNLNYIVDCIIMKTIKKSKTISKKKLIIIVNEYISSKKIPALNYSLLNQRIDLLISKEFIKFTEENDEIHFTLY